MLVAFMFAGCDSGTNVPTDTNAINDSESDVLDPLDDVAIADGAVCVPGSSRCSGANFLVCNRDGSNFDVTTCPTGSECDPKKGCIVAVCKPMSSQCDADGNVQVCLADGSDWSEAVSCPTDQTCIAGGCMSAGCIPGAAQCVGNTLVECSGDPAAWQEKACGDKAICFKGDCIECTTEEQCEPGFACVDGHCAAVPLAITTTDLPEGQIKIAYEVTVEAQGGVSPYTWTIASGALPGGLTMSEDGKISGTPTVAGTYTITVAVLDQADTTVQKPFEIVIHEEGLSIISKSPLPNAEEGTPYEFQFQALGGVPPYGWMIISGELPTGLSIGSNGLLSGTPEAHGDFTFTVRAIDVGEPLSYDTREFTLTVKIAPLVIYKAEGQQEINLFLTKAIILPVIITGIGIPYSAQLYAKGGVKPYVWAESEMTSLLQMLIPKSGVPAGLTMSSDGKITGSVTDVNAAVKLDLSMIGMNYVLEGFFFFAEVTDAQSPADKDSAIFLIPTVPIDIGL